MQSIVRPLESTSAGSVTPSGALLSVADVTFADGSTFAAPMTTHDTVYSPALVTVTSLAVVIVPAPLGDTATACVMLGTGLSYASNARHWTPSGSPASVVG